MTASRHLARARLRSPKIERATAQPQRQRLLEADDVRRLDQMYVGAYVQALAHRRREPLAVHLHLPKLPELLSLSIAALTAPVLLDSEVSPAPFPDDLHDSAARPVAVKGTGPSAWITVTATDRSSHAMIWVDYADRVTRGSAVTVRAITDRSWLHAAPNRLTLAQLLAAAGPSFVETQFHPAGADSASSAAP
jgi:hypothetical protein